MIDPYGDDLEDLSVILYVEATLEICDTIMKSRQPDSVPVPDRPNARLAKLQSYQQAIGKSKDEVEKAMDAWVG